MVGVVTVSLMGVFKARAVLDARATFYTANLLSRPNAPETQTTLDTVNPAIVAGIGAKIMAPAGASAVATVRDVPDAIGAEQKGEVSAADTGKQVDPRFTTVYINRGAGPSAYMVPRE